MMTLCRPIPILIALALIASSGGVAFGSFIPMVTDLTLSGGNITLTFSVPAPGSDPADATDTTTCDLSWNNDQGTSKITVTTNVASPTATLKVLAGNVVNGTAAGTITVSTTGQDFVTGVTNGSGSCDLEYTATATAGDSAGSDVHTVTFTVTTV